MTRAFDSHLAMRNEWPAVEVVASYAGVTRTAVDALVAAGYLATERAPAASSA